MYECVLIDAYYCTHLLLLLLLLLLLPGRQSSHAVEHSPGD